MELYLVLLLVAVATADSHYYHYIPQTYTANTQQLPIIYQAVPAVHTPVLETTNIVQKPFHIQAVPAVYQTQAQQRPTIYKVDDDKVYKVDDDDKKATLVYTAAQVNPVTQVKPVYFSQISHIRTQRSVDHQTEADSSEDEGEEKEIKYVRTATQTTESEESAEAEAPAVKTTDSHILNFPINMPKTTEIKPLVKFTKTSDKIFTHTPVDTVSTSLIHKAKPVAHVSPVDASVEVVESRAFLPINTQDVTTNFKTSSTVHNPLINALNTHVWDSAVLAVHNPVFNTLDTSNIVNSVQTPVHFQKPIHFQPIHTHYTTFNNPVVTPVQLVNQHFFKTVETTDTIKPVHVQKVKPPSIHTIINNQVVTPVHLVKKPVFKIVDSVEETDIIKAVQTPSAYAIINKPVDTPVVDIADQSSEKISPGYVASNPGVVHTAPLPVGPSGEGLFSSHHINMPDDVKA